MFRLRLIGFCLVVLSCLGNSGLTLLLVRHCLCQASPPFDLFAGGAWASVISPVSKKRARSAIRSAVFFVLSESASGSLRRCAAHTAIISRRAFAWFCSNH